GEVRPDGDRRVEAGLGLLEDVADLPAAQRAQPVRRRGEQVDGAAAAQVQQGLAGALRAARRQPEQRARGQALAAAAPPDQRGRPPRGQHQVEPVDHGPPADPDPQPGHGQHRPAHQVLPSPAPRRSSPVATALTATISSTIAADGSATVYHWPVSSRARASVSMFPQLGVFGGIPTPRKLRVDSVSTAWPTSNAATAAIGGSALGTRWRRKIRVRVRPSERAARTKGRPRSALTSARAISATGIQPVTVMAATTVAGDGPATAARVSATRIIGSASSASAVRATAVSSQRGATAASAPTAVPSSTVAALTATPTASE